jgi:hypothetical protein
MTDKELDELIVRIGNTTSKLMLAYTFFFSLIGLAALVAAFQIIVQHIFES